MQNAIAREGREMSGDRNRNRTRTRDRIPKKGETVIPAETATVSVLKVKG
jgi:hypothetical protein